MSSSVLRPGTTQPPPEVPARRPLVWIVDDSPLEAEVIRCALAVEFETELFADGSAVLERSAESPLPDVLVLDWLMPGVSGLEVCRFLRARSNQLPVLLLTVHSDTESLAEGLGAGANDFVSKPFAALELRARVRALFATRRMHESVERAEHARAEVERQRADLAEERLRMSELYLGIIGHDFRNPLTAIGLAATALTGHVTEDQRRKLADGIRSSARRLTEMVDALVDVTRSRLGGGLEIWPERGDLRRLCDQIVDELRLAFPHRQVVVDAAPGPTEVDFDFARMSQVITNLVVNALLHGAPDTPVELTLSRDQDEVRLRVSNQGAPIAPDVMAQLFDPFRRGTAPNQGPAGLGLGLYISQQIVAAHGGTIEVHSAERTCFTVRLPA